jgi:primosomal protein N' (replication factor Y)
MSREDSKDTGQRELFERRPAWEEDDVATGVVATVVLAEAVDRPLDYLVPPSLVAEVQPGRRVRVPLGRRKRAAVGYCVSVRETELVGGPLKGIEGVEDDRPLLSAAMIELTRWMSERWMCRWGEVLEAVLPAGVRLRAGRRRSILLERSGKPPARRPGPAQARVLAQATKPLSAADLAARAGVTRSVVAGLVRAGLLCESKGEPSGPDAPATAAEAPGRPSDLQLSPAQARALAGITTPMRAGRHETFVLFGVTGSGKTEVYLRAVDEALAGGRQAIVLVPEISLTPQTCARFRERFGDVAVLHSHLTPVERHAQWRRIADGRVRVVVGARSAVFAPTPRLGLLVIDEEHESSFKQGTAPRYHARDVAEWRARRESAVLVLGSATPALETLARCGGSGGWRLIEMPERVGGGQLPAVITVDQRDASARGRGIVSPRLAAGIDWALQAGGQVILLLNRRGFATAVQCPACGTAVRCPQCDITLTLHQPGQRGVCHGCGRVVRLRAECGACGGSGLTQRGTGTQRLEDQIARLYPVARVARMDTDTMRSRGSHEQTLERFGAGEIDILVGTQMIAKGLDFPGVMLVGVLQADAALHLPDFRAAERTCQLVTQVAGRSGRGPRGGRVVVQTMSPDHPALRAAATHDYRAFVYGELPLRETLGYPPFGSVVRIVARGVDAAAVRGWLEGLAERLRGLVDLARAAEPITPGDGPPSGGLRVLGPAPAPIARLRDRFRWHLQLQGPDGPRLRSLTREALDGLRTPPGVSWIVDVDPVEML